MTQDVEGLLRPVFRGEIIRREPLAKHTSLKVGGPADIFLIPEDRDDLVALLAALEPIQMPILVLGGGYNILVRDGGVRGLVISLERLTRLEVMDDGCIQVEAGVSLQRLVRTAEDHSLTGIEFLAGIPGTVGGAAAVNAGAHGLSMLDVVETLTTAWQGRTRVRAKAELEYGYRYLHLEEKEIVVGARIHLERGEREEIGNRIGAILAHRREAQQVPYPNAGSFFKNPEGTQAWRLIDDAGLRGKQVGGAQVAEAHANFLVNRGGATAADFLALAASIKDAVRQRSGIELEEEVRIVGEE